MPIDEFNCKTNKDKVKSIKISQVCAQSNPCSHNVIFIYENNTISQSISPSISISALELRHTLLKNIYHIIKIIKN